MKETLRVAIDDDGWILVSLEVGKALGFELVQTINPENNLILGVMCY